jgi:signal transduction histidine kinase
VRDASNQLPSSLRLKAVLTVFVGGLLLAMTIAVLVGAGMFGALDRGLRVRLFAVIGLAGLGAMAATLLFVHLYLGPVLRFAEGLLGKLRNLTTTLEMRVEERTAALRETNTQLRQTLDQNRNMQRQLMDASRRAGMAEVATAVLHNVGNVLNSVNVSAGVVIEAVQQSRVASLGRVAEMIRAHQGDAEWAHFVTRDEKGRKLPAYICTLAEAGAVERRAILDELTSLQRNIDHIKTVVARQQAQVKASIGVVEAVSVTEVVNDAIRLASSAHGRHNIAVERAFEPLPLVRLDRHKLFETLMNLLGNARIALEDKPGERKITVHIRPEPEEHFAIEVEDTGCGIPPENLGKIFTFGFTTRPGGHGFGLHASALAAAEMGGSITVASDGPGRGARFTLHLPCDPPRAFAPEPAAPTEALLGEPSGPVTLPGSSADPPRPPAAPSTPGPPGPAGALLGSAATPGAQPPDPPGPHRRA